MKPADLCVGILTHENGCEIATLDAPDSPEPFRFPASPMGRDTLKVFLAGQRRPLWLAVSGTGAMDLAFAIDPAAPCNTYIVAQGVADDPVALARYASRAV